MEALDISTKWEARVNPKNPTKVINIFVKTKITKEQVEIYVSFIWADKAHRSATTLTYFKGFGIKPTDDGTPTKAWKSKKVKAYGD
eukprot:751727-Ditylum_brightwellii.AAC.1